jgi:1-deoxy-D-xylulose-5-phosphate synthase
MLDFALAQTSPTSIRYPKATVEEIKREFEPIQLGRSEVIEEGDDGAIIVFGTQVPTALQAAHRLRDEGINLTVVNARFCKPLDRKTILPLIEKMPFVLTVEEGTIEGGFGSAVLEACNAEGIDSRHVTRLGLPDEYVMHAERAEQFAELGLDMDGLCRAVRKALAKGEPEGELSSVV